MVREKHKVSTYHGEGKPLIAPKLNRNDKCQCGSGKKQKNCCGMNTQYFIKKPKPESKPVVKTDKEITIDELQNSQTTGQGEGN